MFLSIDGVRRRRVANYFGPQTTMSLLRRILTPFAVAALVAGTAAASRAHGAAPGGAGDAGAAAAGRGCAELGADGLRHRPDPRLEEPRRAPRAGLADQGDDRLCGLRRDRQRPRPQQR